MPTVVKTIGSGAGRDYSTLAGWAASLPANLVTDGNSYEGDCYNDSEFTSAGTQLTLSGHTTDANHTITLTTGAGQSFRDNANVQTNALDYNALNGVGIRSTANGSPTMDCSDINVTFSNLQIAQSDTGTYNVRLSGAGTVNVNNCILKGTYTLTCGADHVVRSSLIIGLGGNTEIVRDGLSTANGGASFYFCTIVAPSDATAPSYNVNSAGSISSGQPRFENCAFFGCSSNVYDNAGQSAAPIFAACMSDVTGPSGVTSGETYASQYQNTTTASGDWREKAGANLQGGGTADSTNGATDIGGTTRPQSGKWDVGCWELLGAGTVVSADAWVPIELLTTQPGDTPSWVEFVATHQADSRMLFEHPGTVRQDLGLMAEAMATQRADRRTRLELAAILRSDLGLAAELSSGVARDMAGQVELSARALTDRCLVAEWLASLLCDVSASDEFAAAVAGGGPVQAECLGLISALLTADAVLPLEWSALSALVLASLERLRSSPGKRRFLGTPGRLRLLKRS